MILNLKLNLEKTLPGVLKENSILNKHIYIKYLGKLKDDFVAFEII